MVNQALGCSYDHKAHHKLGIVRRSYAELLGMPRDLDHTTKRWSSEIILWDKWR